MNASPMTFNELTRGSDWRKGGRPGANVPELQTALAACYEHLVEICRGVENGNRGEANVKPNRGLQYYVPKCQAVREMIRPGQCLPVLRGSQMNILLPSSERAKT